MSGPRKFGLIKELAEPGKVLLDFDGPLPDLRLIWRRLRVCRLELRLMRIDRTQHGWHVVLWLKEPLEDWATLALQAILGSDPRREAMNFARLLAGPKDDWERQRWNILYERKVTA